MRLDPGEGLAESIPDAEPSASRDRRSRTAFGEDLKRCSDLARSHHHVGSAQIDGSGGHFEVIRGHLILGDGDPAGIAYGGDPLGAIP